MGRHRGERLNGGTKFFAHFPASGIYWSLPRADTTSGEHIEVCCAVAVADQQNLARGIEQHHLHAACSRPKQPPEESLRPVGKLDDSAHGRKLM